MVKIYKYLDTTKLPKRGRYIDWKNCVGMELDFIYDNISGKILIEGYENGILNISYNDKKSTIRQNKLEKKCSQILDKALNSESEFLHFMIWIMSERVKKIARERPTD